MESLLIALNAVAPMFILMAVGYGLKMLRFFDEKTLDQVNGFAFKILIPMQLFLSSYQADLSRAVNVGLLLLNLGVTAGGFLVLACILRGTVRAPRKRGTLLQGMFRGNIALIGVAMMQSLFGPEQTGIMAVTVAVVVPLNNILAVLALEMNRGGKIKPRRMAWEIITNPSILGCVSGMAANAIGLHLPPMVLSPIGSMAAASTPVALIVLGASFHFERVSRDIVYITAGVATKLVALPLAALALGVALGFRGAELGVVAVVFSAPTANISFNMAQQMGGDEDLAASIVVFSSMFSCFTIFLWVFLLLQLGLI